MREDIEQAAEEAGARAACSRCKAVIVEESSATGAVRGTYRAIALRPDYAQHFQLCGRCGLRLREFLFPEVEHNPIYLETKRQLEALWAR